jgi:amino acid adenylation domain-containing protein/non-ribosomal peptide synthase protein (TIGR01720 family)
MMKLSNFKLKSSTSNLDRILKDFNATAVEYPRDRTVIDLIDRQCTGTPDGSALMCGEFTVTYSELYRQSNRLAAFLENQGIGAEEAVAHLTDHTIDSIIAIIAILKAGGVFLPLDPDTPYERLKFMLNDASARVLLCEKKYIKTVNRLQWECALLNTVLCMDSERVYDEPEELNELMKEELWDYVGISYRDSISGGGWFSSFSGDAFSKEEMAEYAANVLAKVRPYIKPNSRVLEIGCATGISMFPIAAEVKEYHGTDLSGEILANTRKEVEARNISNIKLSHAAAHDIGKLEDGGFDIVILNSVIQAFNGHNYLRDVIKKCIGLMKPEGIIFFGDIQDLELKDTLVNDLLAYKREHPETSYKTKTDWSNELFLSRLFFHDLKYEFPEVREVIPSLKEGAIKNELTRYNFDVILEIDKAAATQTLRPKSGKSKRQYGGDALAFYRSTSVARTHEPGNLAYIIYTSGSTGAPKGVMIEHRGLVDYVQTFIDQFVLTRQERVLQQVSFVFDASVEEIYPVLCTGGALVLAGDRKDLPGLVKEINRFAVTLVSTSPAVVDYFNHHPGRLTGLRVLISGGDVLKSVSVDKLYKGTILFNTYGPTETTVCATYAPVEQVPATIPGDSTLPIGRPIVNRQVYIMDYGRGLSPVGTAGEICIGGAGAARGYLNNPRLTAEKFIPHPYRPGERLYRSGDRGKWMPDGNIEFLGRIDQQVKIRGYRIEPAEIEYHLLRHPLVKEAVVVAIELSESQTNGIDGESGYGTGLRELAAYFITVESAEGEPKREINTKELRTHLGHFLADYMIPSYFVRLDMLPLTAGGKIDKKVLPSPEGLELTPLGDYAEPRNDLERQLMNIWRDVLKIRNISIHDNFFNLGGHSLKATKVASRIHKELSFEINLKDVFTYQTIAQLARVIEDKSPTPFSTIQPAEEREYYELSNAQRRLWVLDQFEHAGAGYNMPGSYWFKGRLNVPALERSFRIMMERHESLRTCFKLIRGVPYQVVLPMAAVDFSIAVEEPALEELEALLHHHGDEPFDLSEAPLFRLRLLKTAAEEHVFLFDMHHIISDAWSMEIFAAELTLLYNAHAGEEQPDQDILPAPLRIQYRDYAAWQNGFILSAKAEAQKEYWHKTMGNGETYRPLDLPSDFPRPPVKTYNGHTVEHALPSPLASGIRGLCDKLGVTVYMIMVAAVNALLYRYTGQDDIIVGSPIAGRGHADLEDQIGFYVNTVAMRNRVRGDQPFTALLEQVKQSTTDAYDHQLYPFDKLVDELQLDRDTSRHPLFDVMVAVQNADEYDFSLSNLEAIPIENPFRASKFDLTFSFVEQSGTDIPMEINYNTDLFKGDRIHRMLTHFTRLLEGVTSDAGKPVNRIDILAAPEKQQLLQTFNATAADYPADTTLQQLFEEQSARTPDRVALIAADNRSHRSNRSYMTNMTYMSYSRLNEEADRLCRLLKEEGIEPRDIVAIEVRRSAAGIAGILGILKAGAVYLPMDGETPRERGDFILKDSGARLIMRAGEEGVYQFSVINLDWLMDISAGVPEEDGGPAGSASAAYVIYTSGTTGRPKGVIVEHRSIVNTIWWYKNHYQLGASDVLLHQLAFTFDASLIALFTSLVSGARLAALPREQQYDLEALRFIIPRYGIALFNTNPGFYHTMLEEIPAGLQAVKYILVGGEAPDRQMVETHFRMLPSTRLVNDYGPTENSVLSTTYTCRTGDERSSIPIGKPIANTQCFILDMNRNPCPIGIDGEIYLSGAGLTRGYLNNPELTAGKFVRVGSSLLLYRTGDLGRWLPDGNIEFLGRMDHQVKVMGYRIELEEIEYHLLSHPSIDEAAVIARETGGQSYLAAFIVQNGEAIPEKELPGILRAHLELFLPGYMIPRYYSELAQLPLTPNGKIDRNALGKPGIKGQPGYTGYMAPRDKIEEQLAAIWQSVLEQDGIGIHDNFFDLMGHSLKAIQVVSRIYKELEVELPLREIFEKPTIAELAELLKSKKREQYVPIEPVEEKEYYELSNAQRRLWVLHQFENVQTSYNMPSAWELKGPLDIDALHGAFQLIMERHESLRTGFSVIQGAPFQVIHPAHELPFGMEITESSQADQEAAIREFASMVFDLTLPPLFRVKLLMTGEQAFTLLFNMHHIISDGWSMTIFLRELTALYNTFTSPGNGAADVLAPPLLIQYKDYAQWQNRYLLSSRVPRQKKYWHKKLGRRDEIPAPDFPTDYPRPPAKSLFTFEPDLTAHVLTLSNERGCTLFMTLTAALILLIYRYTGQEDIIVGTPVAGRTHPDLENQVGLYINTLALRERVDPHRGFHALLRRVKQTATEAYENQLYPFDLLVDELAPDRDTSRHPLFDILIVMQNTGDTEETFRDIRVSPIDVDSIFTTSKFDLTFTFAHVEDKIHLTINYSTQLFEEDRIHQIRWHLEQLLAGAIQQPELPVKRLELLSEEEKQMLLVDLNDTRTEYPYKTIVQIFEEQVERAPDNIAIVSAPPAGNWSNRSYRSYLTYKELNSKSSQLARYLSEPLGIGLEDRVAIQMWPGTNQVVALLGVLKAGAAFVPLSPDFPWERVVYMLQDSGAGVLIREDWEITKLSHNPSSAPGEGCKPENTAYVIYTSGSAGKPKGVILEHRNMVNYTSWYINEVGLSEEHRLLLTHSFTFDAAFTNMFSSLLRGSQLHLIPRNDYLSPGTLLKYIAAHNITHLKFIPSLFSAIANDSDLAKHNFDNLEFIMLGGEAIQVEDVERFHKAWPHVAVMNHYGPTETTVGSIIQWLDWYRFEAYKRQPTIGRPIHNTGVLILDANQEPAPIGIKGELCIFGDGVARGYVNNPDLTAEKFISYHEGHEEHEEFIKKRVLYRTGDAARWLPSGVIEFLGRTDQQVKVRGFRVELEEIRRPLSEHPDIKDVVVMALKVGEQMQLTAFIVAGKQVKELRSYLGQSLPDYMVPAYFVPLDEIPLTPNGKTDKKALRRIDIQARVSGQKEGTEIERPVNETEELLVGLWQEVLGIRGIGTSDNFFEIGGDSLKAIQVSAALHGHGLHLKISDLFAHPTVKELAGLTGKAVTVGEEQQGIIEGEVPLTPVQTQFFQQSWETNNHFNQDIMLFSKPGFDEELVKTAFTHMLSHHDALRMSYHLEEGGSLEDGRIQVNQVNRALNVHQLNLEVVSIGEEDETGIEQVVEEWANAIQSSLDITNGPLVQLGLFKTVKGDHLLIVVHHLVVDGVSWRILTEDFTAIYRQLERLEEVQLPPKTTSFKYWATELESYAAGPKALKELDYWKEVVQTRVKPLPREVEISGDEKIYRNTKRVTVEFTEEHTHMLLTGAGKKTAEIHDLLLTSLILSIHQWAGMDKIRVNLEGHGREDILEGVDISRTVGWFTSKYPVILSIAPDAAPLAQLESTRRILRSIPNKGIGYGILRYLCPHPGAKIFHNAAEPEINFNYLGEFDLKTADNTFSLSTLSSGNPVSPDRAFPFSVNIDGILAHGQMYLFFTYNTLEYPAASILQLAEHFGNHLFKLAESGPGEPGKEETAPAKVEPGPFSEVLLLNREHDRNVFFFPPSIGLGLSLMGLAGQLQNCAFYAFDYIDRPGRIAEYIDYITDIQPAGPYVLGSYSSGCLVFEVAKALRELGKKVSDIILIDALPSDEKRAKFKTSDKDLDRMISMFLEHIKTAGSMDDPVTIGAIRKKAINHNRFIDSHFNTGQIDAVLHYIRSSSSEEMFNNWKPMTSGRLNLYEGSGKHHEMLLPDYLEPNAFIIRNILDMIFRVRVMD